MNASSASQLGWYARRVAHMLPAEVAWRARDRVLQAAWSRRQVTQEQHSGLAIRLWTRALRNCVRVGEGRRCLPQMSRRRLRVQG
jgi:hypothetical protein